MKARIFYSALLTIAASVMLYGGMTVTPAGGGGGTGNVAVTGTPAAPQSAQWTDATHVKGVAQGVFNVRTMYGAVPNGSTDNATAIAAAFTASNAVTTGIATVYFDCDTSSTTCQYNYGGSGVSAINPTVATSLVCAPGVTLNYTGTAHAVDLGPTNLTTGQSGRYTIEGCQFTGGANYTAGIYVNNYLLNTYIHNNVFWNFGNQTYYSIVYNGNDWTPVVEGNYWRDTDGFTKNMVDAHLGQNVGLLFVNNKNECASAGFTPCSVSTVGVGLWIVTGTVLNNEIKYHYPAIRLGSCAGGSCGAGTGMWIEHNLLEGNGSGTKPAITFGDPGTAGIHMANKPWIANNYFYWPTTGNISYIAPESASSGAFNLDAATLIGNYFASDPNSTTPYANLNQGVSGYVSNNRNNAGYITQSSTNPMIDTGYSAGNTDYGVSNYYGSGTSIANAIAIGDSTGTRLSAAFYHNISTPLTCADSTGSGTTQTCNTSPKFNTGGSAVTVVTGDIIVYKTTTTNTGALTVAINGGAAKTVKKGSTLSDVASGDIVAGVYYMLVYDGTNLQLLSRN